jgi:hypothetical protein
MQANHFRGLKAQRVTFDALRVVSDGDAVMSDQFADRMAAIRQRFILKLDARIDEIESAIPPPRT